jgi:transposase
MICAFKRGRTFGTILVNLQTHQVIDVLADRKAETSASWIACYPEIELMSRDRGGDYASAAATGGPQAVQCSDRFHLVVRRILLKSSMKVIWTG